MKENFGQFDEAMGSGIENQFEAILAEERDVSNFDDSEYVTSVCHELLLQLKEEDKEESDLAERIRVHMRPFVETYSAEKNAQVLKEQGFDHLVEPGTQS